METKDDKYVDVHCPFKYISKSDSKEYLCNRVCARVTPGSAGEGRCRFCRKSFEFVVNDQDAPASVKLEPAKGGA